MTSVVARAREPVGELAQTPGTAAVDGHEQVDVAAHLVRRHQQVRARQRAHRHRQFVGRARTRPAPESPCARGPTPGRAHCRSCRHRVGRDTASSPTSRSRARRPPAAETPRDDRDPAGTSPECGSCRFVSVRLAGTGGLVDFRVVRVLGSGLLVRVGVAGRGRVAATRATSSSAARARASSSSMCRAVSGTVSATNVSVGVNRTPVPAPTFERRTPLAFSSPAAAAARSGSDSRSAPITV